VTPQGRAIFIVSWLVTLALLIAAVSMVIWRAPIDPDRGLIQHIMYLHLATAINTLFACVVVFAANCAYIWRRDPRWDAAGDAGARVVVLLGFIVLLTGMIWAKRVWGHWWEWSPPLTFSLILWLLYVGYLVNRALQRSPDRKATRSAAFGIFAFLDVPLVYLSIRLLPGSHTGPVERAQQSGDTLALWLLAMLFLTAGLIITRAMLTGLRRRRHAPSPDALTTPSARPTPRMIA